MKVSHIGLLFGLIGLAGAVPSFATPSICGAVSGNLVLNCGFETGDFTNWNTTPAATGTDFGVTTNVDNSGSDSARFGASGGSNDYIDQSFTTIAGDTYSVSFYVDSGLGVSPSGQFVANWNGSNILTIAGSNSNSSCAAADAAGYNLCSFTETATSTSTNIQFGGNTVANYYHLDDVVITQNTSAVPEPSSISFAVTGLFGLLLAGRRYMQKRSNS